MGNPVFKKSNSFRKNSGFSLKSSDNNHMTYDDVFEKISLCFGVLVASASFAWIMNISLFIGCIALFLAFGIALFAFFKQNFSPFFVLLYAFIEGIAVGVFSNNYNSAYSGIVAQALMGTLIVSLVSFALFRSKVVRATKKFRKIVLVATLSYLAFAIVRLVLSVLGIWTFQDNALFGIIVGMIAITLGAFNLVIDFDDIEIGVKNKLPIENSWICAFGLLITLVWMYFEFLRFLSYLRD